MIEIDDEPACYIHGLISSDSDNDSDDMREFDEEYNLMKPPPYDYKLIKNKIIIISSQNTPNVHVQQDQSTEEKNNNKTKKTEVVSKVAVTKKTENPTQKLNMTQIRNKKTKIERKKVDMSGQVTCGSRKSTETICSNQILKAKVKSKYSKNKTIKKRSAAKLRDLRTREENYLGLNIITREQFEKEFPSLDEVHKSKFRSACKLYKTKPTSSSIWNKKKKKQFKPLEIEIYYKYIPKGKYLPEVKNRRNGRTMIKVKFGESKTQHDIIPQVTNETNKSKRKLKRKLKQSAKELLTQHNENLSNISKGQRVKKNLNHTNDIQGNVDLSIGNENRSINLDLRRSLNDDRDAVQYENIFDREFKNFVQNIIYEGTNITDLNCFTYKQLHLAYTAYLRKNTMENSSNKAENIVINTSSEKKKPIKKNKKVKQPTTKPCFDTMLDSERYLFIDGKRKMKRKLTQSMKVLLNKNVLDKFGYIRHITQLAGGKTHTKICLPIDIYKYNYY